MAASPGPNDDNKTPEQRVPAPWYETVRTAAVAIIAGILGLGGLLDAASNAVQLISPRVTYVGTAIACLAFLALLLPNGELHRTWLADRGGRLQLSLGLVGILLLLWLPRLPMGSPAPPPLPPPSLGPTNASTQPSPTLATPRRTPSPLTSGADQALAATDLYLNTSVPNSPRSTSLGIVLIDDSGRSTKAVEAMVGRAAEALGQRPVHAFFRPRFYEEGHARALFDGEWAFAKRLALQKYLDFLFLGRTQVAFEPNPQFQDLKTARIGIEVRCVRLETQSSCGEERLVADGAGFTDTAAEDVAIGHLAPALQAFLSHMDRAQ